MLRADPSRNLFLTGLTVSMIVHVLIWGVASGFVRIGSQHEAEPAKQASKVAKAPAPPPRPKIKLGLDNSKGEGLSWLGYTEATEHSAPLSSIDQSSMSPTPGSAAEAPAPAVAPPQLQELANPNPQPVTSQQTQEAAQAMAQVGHKLTDALRALAKPQPRPDTTQAQPSTSAGSAPQSPGLPGLPADKESIATAVRKAPTVKPGQVLAANGLDIQTKAPKWSFTTMQTRRPGNPTVQITFGRDGKVVRAGFVTDGHTVYSTGYEDVDEPLLSAIYSWTARGKKLSEYTIQDPNGEVTILVTILLS
jgi:hypothetical protein